MANMSQQKMTTTSQKIKLSLHQTAYVHVQVS